MCSQLGVYNKQYKAALHHGDFAEASRLKKLIIELEREPVVDLRIRIWDEATIGYLSSGEPEICRAQFGWMTTKKDGSSWPVFNVRVEGGYNNVDNDPKYNGPYSIDENPYVGDLILSNRCVIPADFFIEQPSGIKSDRKFLFKRLDEQKMHLAGVFKEVKDEASGELKKHFCILTTAHNTATSTIKHERSPVVIPIDKTIDFLDPIKSMADLTEYFPPSNGSDYTYYEVNNIISKKECPYANDDMRLIEPMQNLFM